MTAANSPALPDAELAAATLPRRGRRALLWGGTASLVLAAHLAVFLQWQRARAPAGVMRAPPAVMIDLAPLPAPPTPAAPPMPAAPPPPVTPPPAIPAPVPPPPTLTPAPPLALPVAESAATLPAPPPPPPSPPKRKTARPVAHRLPPVPPPTAVPRRVTTAKPVAAPAPAPSAADAQAPAPARPAASSGAAPQDWRSRLVAHIAQYKTYPSIAQANDWTGTAVVRFTFRRDGTVIGVDLVRGSGHAALDQAAISTLRRASPLPPPPAGVAGDPITLSLPLQFSLDRD